MSDHPVGDAAVLTDDLWSFVESHRVARLATTEPSGRPHVVPICYATDRTAIYSALDEKPKRVAPTRLRRVRNILARPDAAFLVDDYAEDWSRLAYVLVRCRADLVLPATAEHARAIALLRQKYPQYERMRIDELPVIRMRPTDVAAWSATPGWFAAQAAHSPRYLDFDAVIRGRRSVRAYRPDPVPRELVERVLELARWAPSPHGRMPWRFVVLTRPESRARLAGAMGAEWERQLAMDGEPPEVVADRLARSHERVRGAPVLVLVCLYLEDLDRYPDEGRQSAETTMAIQSLGAAAQNLLLAAYEAGLDAGWLCAPLFCQDTVRQALDLPPTFHPHALLTLGYAAREPRRRARRPLSEIVTWDQ